MPSDTPPASPDTAWMPARVHARRLREVYRSAGWPCQDMVEVELLAAGLLERVQPAGGAATLRVTDAGLAHIAASLVRNRAGFDSHEALVARVACEMQRAGRIAWRGLGLRARVPGSTPDAAPRWCIARPDVFSIRNTTVEDYALPIAHEIKVRRADLLGDLRRPAKRAAYLDLASECWYVLGCDARGRPIGDASEVPPECGVLVVEGSRLAVARPAPRRARRVDFGTWMALARATPVARQDEDVQPQLGCCPPPAPPRPAGP